MGRLLIATQLALMLDAAATLCGEALALCSPTRGAVACDTQKSQSLSWRTPHTIHAPSQCMDGSRRGAPQCLHVAGRDPISGRNALHAQLAQQTFKNDESFECLTAARGVADGAAAVVVAAGGAVAAVGPGTMGCDGNPCAPQVVGGTAGMDCHGPGGTHGMGIGQ